MKSIAVIGARGMLGRTITKYLSKNGDYAIHAFTRNPKKSETTNVTYLKYKEIFDSSRKGWPYDYLINCAGVLRLQREKPHALRDMIDINTILPIHLSLNGIANKIINISTDDVFSGKNGGYSENSIHDPTSMYGYTKSLGEVNDAKVINLRCSIVGPEELGKGRNLLGWFLSQPQDVRISGYTDHLWNGITTLQYAKICNNIISGVRVGNVQHVVPQDYISKYDLLNLFNIHFNKKMKIEPMETKRPVNKTLRTINPKTNKNLWSDNILSIEDMVVEMREAWHTLK